MATLTKQEIDEKVFNLTSRLAEIKKDKKIANKDFKDRMGDIQDEIDDLIEQGNPASVANHIGNP